MYLDGSIFAFSAKFLFFNLIMFMVCPFATNNTIVYIDISIQDSRMFFSIAKGSGEQSRVFQVGAAARTATIATQMRVKFNFNIKKKKKIFIT